MKKILPLAILFFSVKSWSAHGDIVPGQFIISVQDGVEIEEVLRDYGLSPRHRYHRALKGFAGKISTEDLHRMLSDNRIRLIEQDRVVVAKESIQEAPPSWGLDRIDQRNLPLNSQYVYNYDGTGVTAYVIDSGINMTHVDFSGRAQFGFDVYGGNGVDCTGHGSHVAGTIGGTKYGVAKNVKLVSVRVLNCNGEGTTSSVIAGIDWVRLNHVKPAVANISLGGSSSSSLDTAVINLINSGVTVAVAAGNSNTDACFNSPGRVPEAITVGASDRYDMKSSFSNWGSCVDFFAPGSSIVSAGYTATTTYSVKSGTSMATPHVTGAAALYLQQVPTASPLDVRNYLYSQTSKSIVTSANSVNNHLLYAYAPYVPPVDATPPKVTITAPLNNGYVYRGTYVSLKVSASDNVGVTRVKIYKDGYLYCTDTTAPYTCSWKVPTARGITYRFRAKAEDAAGNYMYSTSVYVTSK